MFDWGCKCGGGVTLSRKKEDSLLSCLPGIVRKWIERENEGIHDEKYKGLTK